MQSTVTDPFTDRVLLCWWVWTTEGRKTTWALSREEAESKAKERGLKVLRVTPRDTLVEA